MSKPPRIIKPIKNATLEQVAGAMVRVNEMPKPCAKKKK